MLRRLRLLPVFSEAMVALLCARLELWCAFRPHAARPNATVSSNPNRIAWAINRAATFVPRATCLVRAMAAQRVLARYGYYSDVHIGVAKSEATGFEAHAWVEYEGKILVGGTTTEYTRLLNWSAAQ